MALISELLASVMILVTRGFSMLKEACLFPIRIGLVVIYTWTELIRTAIIFNVNIVLGIISWTIGLIFLPVRAVNAIQRERQLEQQLHRMQTEMENLEWKQNKLQERFQMALKECKMMEMLLAELEEEHDMAVAKIENLEGKLRGQINENLRLKEIQGKGYWNSKDQNIDNDRKIEKTNNGIPPPNLPWKSGNSENEVSLKDLLMHKDMWEDEDKTRIELLKLLKTGQKSAPANSAAKPEPISKDIEVSEVLDHHRYVAISQSIFSAVLSLIVGVTVWEADDPCMPLIVALFAVVGMSLKSVVQFFFSIKNKPASDAVALLSFNWFILGTLTYPTLPRVAPMLAPLVLRFLDQTMTRFGLLSLV
ncbi:hypothetical protein MtrunA17_Chr5g0408321 [Medicago truncatula]|uniref:Transmembrane protein, putative n=1 Tax=Medicago truncatula TaxID=3880 RepID=G7K433_MEDTR|nr:uncharacterized protein LOC11410963 [Medicago truncatula]AES95465.1 transmembrane protein, putative [Medicago truncatula]RHN54566.1 hypothetical protein MtrunA17_Chr5g0408321 [Medicago truncatula]